MKKKQADKAWETFFESRKVFAVEDLTAEGWIIGEDVAKKLGVRQKHLNDRTELECKLFRVLISGQSRERSFYRPKVLIAAK